MNTDPSPAGTAGQRSIAEPAPPVRRRRTLLALLLVALATGLGTTTLFDRVDHLLFDLHLALWRAPAAPDVVLVVADDVSIAALGRWPWPRRTHAALLDRLTDAGAAAVAFSIGFSEPDPGDPASDAALARAIQRSGKVVLPVFPEAGPEPGMVAVNLPLEVLRRHAVLGHADVQIDVDGLVRSVYLEAGLPGQLHPQIGLAALSLLDAPASFILRGERQRARAVDGAPLWQRDYRLLLPLLGKAAGPERLPFHEVLVGQHRERLDGRVVFVGVTAAGINGAIPTPASGRRSPMPAVEFNASVFESLRRDAVMEPLARWMAVPLTALLVLLPLLAYPRVGRRWLPVAIACAHLAPLLLAMALSLLAHRWFPPATALAVIALGYPLWSWRELESSMRALSAEREQARATLQSIADGVFTTDAAGTLVYANAVGRHLLDAPLEQALGRPLDEMLSARGADGRRIALGLSGSATSAGIPTGGEIVFLGEAKARRAVRMKKTAMHDVHGRITGHVVAMSDVTELLAMNDELQYQATHDALTRIPNRFLLHDRLEQLVARAARQRHILCVMFIDLDDFKKVNDSFGHEAGDSLLMEISARLLSIVRASDTVARWGGDEFVVVVDEVPDREAAAMLARKILAAFEHPLRIGERELDLTASIGISLFPDDGVDPATLLRSADTAMYRIKARAKGAFGFYAADMSERSSARLQQERAIRTAVDGGELQLVYQPEMDLASRRITGVEALLRWRAPDGSLSLPPWFIPVAEETGLIHRVGDWVVRAAFAQAVEWRRALPAGLSLSINLSGRQLMHPDFLQRIAAATASSGVEPSMIRFEITESVLMHDLEQAVALLQQLKQSGFGLSIDDFGTGYASLSYLRRFPVDEIKIDRSFVQHAPEVGDDAAIVGAVLSMARGMDLQVVAEGVETEAQLEFLAARGCDIVQGWLISYPLEAQAATAFISSRGVAAPAKDRPAG